MPSGHRGYGERHPGRTTRRLKVYGWTGMRFLDDKEFVKMAGQTHHLQSREIVAARSKAEAARIAGVCDPRQLFNLCETGNAAEIAVATGRPGTIFYKPIDTFYGRAGWLEQKPWRG